MMMMMMMMTRCAPSPLNKRVARPPFKMHTTAHLIKTGLVNGELGAVPAIDLLLGKIEHRNLSEEQIDF